ncbi:HAD family hydrolase [Salinibacterium sp.]|uniref:HAD family hydrolase n=1 Tax=Salinibacterium sp. TaxID=1915057 RepID=UPI00286C6D9F|nr:HAD family hydrolase [Salinibacterium sp.]
MSPATERWLIALDIDGTVLREDGVMNEPVIAAVQKVRDAGHEVMLATGRSVAMTLPILERLSITPEYVVCSNGAITLRRDPDAPSGYVRDHVETFNPSEVLTTIRANLETADYAVEDEDGLYRFTGHFPDGTLGAASEKVPFEELLTAHATRVVVISPGHKIEDFLSVVERMGLHKVSYNVGWTAWLDIAPDGVNKSTALERVRNLLDIPRSRVMAVGDGRNDIDMLEWASVEGRGVSMGQAPDEVIAASNERTASDIDDGVATLLDTF